MMNEMIYYDTFAELVNSLNTESKQIAVAWYDRQKNLFQKTRGELYSDVCRLAKSLSAQKLFGANIAIVGENCYDWIVSFLAVAASGNVAVCIDVEQPDDSIRDLIKNTDCRLLLVTPPFYQICASLRENDVPPQIVVINDRDKLYADKSLAAFAAVDELQYDWPSYPSKQCAAIIFTSGTTGIAKSVMLSHRNLLYNAAGGVSLIDLHNNIYSALPFYHSYGLNCTVVAALLKSARLIINCDIRMMMRDLMLSCPETAIVVPLMAETIYNSLLLTLEKTGRMEQTRKLIRRGRRLDKIGIHVRRRELITLKNQQFGALRLMICGGAHLEQKIVDGLADFGITVLLGYGITECSPLVSINQIGTQRGGSVGQVIPKCEVKIEKDEILVRGDNVMLGYYNDDQLTQNSLSNGWYHTGDLGYMDKDGFLYITGRKKNLIVLKNGKKVSPEKLELLVKTIPLVQDVVAYGAVSGSAADDVKPAVSIFPNQQMSAGLTSYEILEMLQREINSINASLPLYQQIQMITIREKEFVKNSSNKIIRDFS